MNRALFESKINKTESCWIWLGAKTWNGYGYVQFHGDKITNLRAHRYSYILAKGEIPKGLVLDHLCRNTLCVNPDHLEPVTHRVNILRGVGVTAKNIVKTHCKHGHPLSGSNVYNPPKRPNNRHCLTCRDARNRARYAGEGI